MAGSASKIKFRSYDDLFGDAGIPGAVELPLDRLEAFHSHPFKVIENDSLQELADSIREKGVMVPAIARRIPGSDRYELISGHRRKRACEIAGLDTMPVRIVELSDDDATIYMVDTNLYREEILPSEKAWAYRMKFEAMSHQGIEGGRTISQIGEASGESGKTVQRYIRLTKLLPGLLEMVDTKKLGFVPALDISFLKEDEQGWVLALLAGGLPAPDSGKSGQLKKYSQEGELTRAVAEAVLSAEKDRPRGFTMKQEKISRYFPASYSSEQIESVIISLLEQWKERNG